MVTKVPGGFMVFQRKVILGWLVLFLTVCCGCTSTTNGSLQGFFLTYTKIPYTIDLHNTPVGSKKGKGTVIQIKEPVSGYGIYTELNSNAIGDIAKKNGMKKVYYADLEILIVLRVWKHNKINIYGE